MPAAQEVSFDEVMEECRVSWTLLIERMYYQSRRAKYGRERTKNGREQTKMIFLLLQLHNRSIDCIDTCNLSFCRLLDAIRPACKEYN